MLYPLLGRYLTCKCTREIPARTNYVQGIYRISSDSQRIFVIIVGNNVVQYRYLRESMTVLMHSSSSLGNSPPYPGKKRENGKLKKGREKCQLNGKQRAPGIIFLCFAPFSLTNLVQLQQVQGYWVFSSYEKCCPLFFSLLYSIIDVKVKNNKQHFSESHIQMTQNQLNVSDQILTQKKLLG